LEVISYCRLSDRCSRFPQLESSVYGYYGWSPSWYPGYGMAMMGALPITQSQPSGYRADGSDPTSGDPNLRSANEITGYYVRASDDDIGHVEELLVDIESWDIRYFVVDTKTGGPERRSSSRRSGSRSSAGMTRLFT
jgi:hypothetical protein